MPRSIQDGMNYKVVNTRVRSEEEKGRSLEATRASLDRYLTARRERIGQSAQDVRESPEAVLERQKLQLHTEQRKLVDDYVQNTASERTM